MSQENVEIVRRCNAAFSRGDREGALAFYHPEAEWRDLRHAPDTPERVHGLPALRALMEQWDAVFDEFTVEVEEYIEVGDCVVAMTRWLGRGKESGLAIDLHTADGVELADGRRGARRTHRQGQPRLR